MKTGGIVTCAIAVLVLALTGCAAASEPAPAEPQSFVQSAPSETSEPLVAETPAAASADDADAEALFVGRFHEIRATMPGESFIPNATDEQLIAAGWDACERLDAGESSNDITLIEGETKNGADYYSDSGAIVTAARQSICLA